MSDQIDIKDINGKSILSFSHFRARNTIQSVDQVFIEFQVTLMMKENVFRDNLRAELSDFEEMLDHLEVLNLDLKRTFYFQHSDERIKVKFAPNLQGQINIDGFLALDDNSMRVEFNFKTDQSFIGDLIESCKKVISMVKVESFNR